MDPSHAEAGLHKPEPSATTTPMDPATPRDSHDDVSEKRFPLWDKAVTSLGIEVQGSEPVAPHQQTEKRYLKLYTLWFSMNFNLIA